MSKTIDLFTALKASLHPIRVGKEKLSVEQCDAVEWLQKLPDECVDLVCVDPAYESLEKHRAKGTTTRLKVSDGSSNEWFPIFHNDRFEALFREYYRVLKKNTHFYMYCDQETMFVAKPIAEACGFKFWKPLVWDKVSIGLGYHYRCRHEFILFFEKGKRKLNDLGIPDVIECKRINRKVKCECQAQGILTPKATSRSTLGTENTESNTILSGSIKTVRSRKGCRSTISTTTSKTTESKTLSSLTRQPTNESIRAASFEKESGGNHVEYVEHLNLSPASTGTLPPTVDGQFLAAVAPVTSKQLFVGKKKNVCLSCGRLERKPWPTEKPWPVSYTLIGQSTQPGDVVIDTFCGSGSTGEAALRLDRRFFGCDVQEKAVRATLERLTPFTL